MKMTTTTASLPDGRVSGPRPGSLTDTYDHIELTQEQQEQLREWKIKGVHVDRGGVQLLSWAEDGADRPASIYSCTKSVLSALVGIAISQGLIGPLDSSAADYLDPSDEGLQLALERDPRKRSITLQHLLTMTSGLDWPDFDKPYRQLKEAESQAAFVYGRELISEPGSAFNYNTGASQLLSIIVSRAAGMSLAKFARRHLFGPLGIGKVKWNRIGRYHEGGAGLSLTMADLTKFGRLYVQRGMWEGKEILPPEWVEQSTAAHHKGLLHYEPTIYGCYGYHWWVSPQDKQPGPDYYFAFGYGGQYLFVLPSLNMTVVVRKGLDGRNNSIYSRRVLTELVIPAATGHSWRD